MMRYSLLILIVFFCFSCNNTPETKLNKGLFRAELTAKENQKIPFTFKVLNDSLIHIFNGDEVIKVTNIRYHKDSIRIQTPVFEGYISAVVQNKKIATGNFINPSFNRIVPFKAIASSERFATKNLPLVNVSGTWETIFSKNNSNNSYKATGIFKQEGKTVTGTFLTKTGDYRFLEGVVDGDSLKLSAFDGIHTFLFKAKATDSTLNGLFYSGNHWKEPFEAKLNNAYELPIDANATYIKQGYENFDFAFPDSKGRVVSLSDSEFKSKVVVVQIMGSWCPNSLDETNFLVAYLKQHPNENLKVISLDIEVTDSRINAYKNIERLKQEVGIPYDVLLTQFGRNGSKKAVLEKLPMLNKLNAYPTLLILDKDKKTRKIYTSFNGPATGEKFTKFQEDFHQVVTDLLAEIH